MPAIPALIAAGAAIGSSYIAKKASEEASQQSPDQLAATRQQTSLAGTQQRQGQQLFGAGLPAIQNTLNYYRTLMGRGGRAAGQAAVAPAAQNIASTYRGAERGLMRSGVQGGVRDQAVADLNRDKAGQTSRLLAGVAGGAADKAGELGAGLMGTAGGFEQGAQGAYADLSHGAQQRSQFGQGVGDQTGQAFGQLLAGLMNAYGGRSNTASSAGTGPLKGGYATLGQGYGSTANPVPYTPLAGTQWPAGQQPRQTGWQGGGW